jgi:fumarylpyruvate hydrolase
MSVHTVVEAVPATLLAVAGQSSAFPVHRIYCVGRNYAEHAREMGASGREAPFFFAKPADALLYVESGSEGECPYPPRTDNLHHEIELVVALSTGGANLGLEAAAATVWGYAIGIDLTRRDLQQQAKDKGRPWDTAKGFDHSAPIGPLHPVSSVGVLERGAIWLEVNGAARQRGDLGDMIWKVGEMLAELSTYFVLRPGDLVFTGTPAGVAAIQRGDRIRAGIDGLGELRLRLT